MFRIERLGATTPNCVPQSRTFLFKANPETALVLLQQRQIGRIHWAMDDSRRLIVWADTVFEEGVENVAQDVVSRQP